VLVDTTFWADLERERRQGRLGPARRFIGLHRSHELRISIITWGELAVGVGTVAELDRLLSGIRVLMLPRQVAWCASRLERQLAASGNEIGENDNWIAATALTWGLRLVTRDEAFRRVPGLRVVGY
jgi:predicted nucleic acid-binding protein